MKHNVYKIREHGFTLIELVMVLVVLGILSALVASKFIYFIDYAREERLKAVKYDIENKSSDNLTRYITSDPKAVDISKVSTCADAVKALVSDFDDNKFQVSGNMGKAGNGVKHTCKLTDSTSNQDVDVYILGVGGSVSDAAIVSTISNAQLNQLQAEWSAISQYDGQSLPIADCIYALDYFSIKNNTHYALTDNIINNQHQCVLTNTILSKSISFYSY